ncbi:MAG: hypothetical protein QXV94_05090 [Thermoplasmata archaeon]
MAFIYLEKILESGETSLSPMPILTVCKFIFSIWKNVYLAMDCKKKQAV